MWPAGVSSSHCERSVLGGRDMKTTTGARFIRTEEPHIKSYQQTRTQSASEETWGDHNCHPVEAVMLVERRLKEGGKLR